MITIIVEYVKIYKTRKKQKKLFPVISMYGKQLSGIVMSRTTELTTIYNNLILLKQKPGSFEAKPDSFETKTWLFWWQLEFSQRKLGSFNEILNSQKHNLAWFFSCKLEFSETQTWFPKNASNANLNLRKDKLDFWENQCPFTAKWNFGSWHSVFRIWAAVSLSVFSILVSGSRFSIVIGSEFSCQVIISSWV